MSVTAVAVSSWGCQAGQGTLDEDVRFIPRVAPFNTAQLIDTESAPRPQQTVLSPVLPGFLLDSFE